MAGGSTRIIVPLLAVVILAGLALLTSCAPAGQAFLCTVLPYAAFALFAGGLVARIILWGKSAVPFCIPTTGGQQKSLPWIKQNKVDNPSSTLGAATRIALEVFFFRSLFKNSKTQKRGTRLGVGSAKWLWFFGLLFHWSMLIIVVRHLRLFFEPVPAFIGGVEAVDTFLHVGVPLLYLTDVIILVALSFLFLRRVVVPRIRYISLPADYFALFVLLAIVISGVLMRYIFKVDMLAVKEITMGLVSLHPVVPASTTPVFCVHLAMVCVLLLYFPWSKLVHAVGVFLSPTKNLPNISRAKRHINPWNYPVEVHTYEQYEDDFRDKMIMVGLPVDKPQEGE